MHKLQYCYCNNELLAGDFMLPDKCKEPALNFLIQRQTSSVSRKKYCTGTMI